MSLKIQTPILLANKSTDEPVAPSGFGEIFASGSKVYFRSDTGSGVFVSQNLTRSGSVVINEYTSSGFWVKPNNISEIYVLCIAGGGGAGSGRVSASGTGSAGGGGSGGGSITARRFRANALTAVSYSITVGVGGTGGASQTTNGTNGLNGSAGTASSFAISGSTILVGSVGGLAGSGGTTTGGTAAGNLTPTAAVPNVYPYAMGSVNAANGSTTTGATGNTGFPGAAGGESGNAAGAGGGGVSAANAAGNGGFNGGVYVTTIAANSGSSLYRGTVASPNCPSSLTLGSNVKRDLLHFVSSRLTTYGAGLGGGGGAGATGSNAGSGSDGGNYGAGAGGGGGARNGFSSGPGGKGGDGLVYIVEYYY